MKILDRYIFVSIAGAFLFGLAMFTALLTSITLMQKLIEMITEQHIPVGMALTIFAYRIPGNITYAFPMSVLLSILLTFNQMSSDSEMVAIRAAGVSFLRIMAPAMVFALLITGVTFCIADIFSPFAEARANQLTLRALQTARGTNPIGIPHLGPDGKLQYFFVTPDYDIEQHKMNGVSLLLYQSGVPTVYVYAQEATWDKKAEHWQFKPPGSVNWVKPGGPSVRFLPIDNHSLLDVKTYALKLKESPSVIDFVRRDPEEITAVRIRKHINDLIATGGQDREVARWENGLARRYAVPFASLVFALIGAALGLRHHRTSGATGLGISILVIFAYYLIAHYLSVLGENGRVAAVVAAWTPNILGGLLGAVLVIRANR